MFIAICKAKFNKRRNNMTRLEIKDMFRVDNQEIPDNVVTDAQLNNWLQIGDKEVCAATRCIVDQDGTTIETAEDDEYYDLTAYIEKFYDIDAYPASGITYNAKRIEEKTMAELDAESPSWRSRSSGTPRAYYRRGKWIYLDRPIDSNAYDIKVYSVLISDDFDDDDKLPFNQLPWLEPFHNAMVLYIQKRAKEKVGKPGEGQKAKQEFSEYIAWMAKEIGGGKYTATRYIKSGAYA